jgi:hypothetical protein
VSDAAPARPRGGRVVIVLASLTMGGAEAQLATILEADPERLRRTRVTILTLLPTTGTLVERRLRALGIAIDTIDRGRQAFPAFLLALVRYLRRQRPDIVHTFLGGSTGTWGRIAARLAGVRAVLHSDLSLEPDLTRVQRVLEPHVHRLTTRFLPNAVAIAE